MGMILTRGNLYFVQEGTSGCIKIGWTSVSVQGRLTALQTGNSADLQLLGFIPNCPPLTEKSWHERFGRFCRRSEWFWPAAELLAAINEALASPPLPAEIVWDGPRIGPADIRAWMAKANMSVSKVALATGYSVAAVRQNLESYSGVTPKFAYQIERITNGEIKAAALLQDVEIRVAERIAAKAAAEAERLKFVEDGGTDDQWWEIQRAQFERENAARKSRRLA